MPGVKEQQTVIYTFKRKIFLVLCGIFFILLAGILGSVNLMNYRSSLNETDKLLEIGPLEAASNDTEKGNAPDKDSLPLNPERKASPVYTVRFNADGTKDVTSSFPEYNYTKKKLATMAESFLSQNKTSGIYRHFRYRILQTQDDTIVSFVDFSIWEAHASQMMLYSVFLFFASMLLFMIIARFLTGWLVKPVIQNYQRQKEFISDAGHELKTPLAIIKSSLEMQEYEYGDTKYTAYMKEEQQRMTGLIHDMLTLSMLEGSSDPIKQVRLDFSHLTEGSALPFECLAYENQLSFQLDIQKDIFLHGNHEQLSRLIGILLDNAIKHTEKNGLVHLLLFTDRGKVVLEVRNQGNPIPKEERENIFRRFYRIDKSRERAAGGYGLGLSIALSIAHLHKAAITVDHRDLFTVFSVKFAAHN